MINHDGCCNLGNIDPSDENVTMSVGKRVTVLMEYTIRTIRIAKRRLAAIRNFPGRKNWKYPFWCCVYAFTGAIALFGPQCVISMQEKHLATTERPRWAKNTKWQPLVKTHPRQTQISCWKNRYVGQGIACSWFLTFEVDFALNGRNLKNGRSTTNQLKIGVIINLHRIWTPKAKHLLLVVVEPFSRRLSCRVRSHFFSVCVRSWSRNEHSDWVVKKHPDLKTSTVQNKKFRKKNGFARVLSCRNWNTCLFVVETSFREPHFELLTFRYK